MRRKSNLNSKFILSTILILFIECQNIDAENVFFDDDSGVDSPSPGDPILIGMFNDSNTSHNSSVNLLNTPESNSSIDFLINNFDNAEKPNSTRTNHLKEGETELVRCAEWDERIANETIDLLMSDENVEEYDNYNGCRLKPSWFAASPSGERQFAPALRPSPNYWPQFFIIPQAGKEVIKEDSYITMTVEICSDPFGQLMIIDEGSGEQLLSFDNQGSTRQCNYWSASKKYKVIMSDSDRVRVEMRMPYGEIDQSEHTTYMTDKDKGVRIKNFKGYELTIQYSQVKFQNPTITLDGDNDTNLSHKEDYMPNRVATYILRRIGAESDVGLQWSAVNITLEHLDLDLNTGDFLLIGAGDTPEPANRSQSKPRVIANNILRPEDETKIRVEADAAYIQLVTHNSLKTGQALKFSWTPPNATETGEDSETYSLRIRNAAIQICVMGYTCQSFENLFQNEFKEELTDIANEFLLERMHESTLVSTKSVLLFYPEDDIRLHQERSEIYCQINLAIINSYNWPLISSGTLHELFFGRSSRKEMHSFGRVTVTDCSREAIPFWSMLLPILIILIVSVTIMLIAWRYQYVIWSKANKFYVRTPAFQEVEDDFKSNPIFVDSPNSVRKANAVNSKSTNFSNSQNFLITHQSNGRPLSAQISNTTDVSDFSYASFSGTSAVIQAAAPQNDFRTRDNPSNFEQIHRFSVSKNVDQTDDPITAIRAAVAPSTSSSLADSQTGQHPEQVGQQNSQVAEIEHQPQRSPRPSFVRLDSTLSDSTLPNLPRLEPTPITGKHGTQHESLRSFPKSALRRSRLPSESETAGSDNELSLGRMSRVKFAELPFGEASKPRRAPLLINTIEES